MVKYEGANFNHICAKMPDKLPENRAFFCIFDDIAIKSLITSGYFHPSFYPRFSHKLNTSKIPL